MTRFVVALACVTTLAGCSLPLFSGPKYTEPDPAAVDSAAVTPRDSAGAIVVMREKQLRDANCIYDVGLDGRPVAELRRGERVTLYADPGRRIVSVSIRPENDCDPAMAEFPLQVVARARTDVSVKSLARYDLKIEATTH